MSLWHIWLQTLCSSQALKRNIDLQSNIQMWLEPGSHIFNEGNQYSCTLCMVKFFRISFSEFCTENYTLILFKLENNKNKNFANFWSDMLMFYGFYSDIFIHYKLIITISFGLSIYQFGGQDLLEVEIMRLYCTQPSIITLRLSWYDWNNFKKDVKLQVHT